MSMSEMCEKQGWYDTQNDFIGKFSKAGIRMSLCIVTLNLHIHIKLYKLL